MRSLQQVAFSDVDLTRLQMIHHHRQFRYRIRDLATKGRNVGWFYYRYVSIDYETGQALGFLMAHLEPVPNDD